MRSLSLFTSLPRHSCRAFLLLGASAAFACGPDFPNRYLDRSEKDMLAAPEGYFAVEINRMAPAPHPNYAMNVKPDAAETGEGVELRAALLARGESPATVGPSVLAYENFRRQQTAWAGDKKKPQTESMPSGLPPEFSLYLTGAQAWHEGDGAGAKKAWLAVLSLPEAERHYRSTWAAYMLARSASADELTEEGQRRYEEVRVLAETGFADAANLAGASYGEEGRWALANHDYARALDCYLRQYATGDETAYASLRLTASAAANADETRQRQIAKSPRARRVLTAWFLARFVSGYGEVKPEPLQHWTKALAAEKIGEVEEADRLAWVAYEAGDFELAKIWARLAPEATPETHWIRGKLALRDGDLTLGAKELQMTMRAPELSPLYRSMVGGELGRILLALDRREDALKVWLSSEHWEDSAYVAEKVMTVDELKKFVTGYREQPLAVFEPYWGQVITPDTMAPSPDNSHRTSTEALRQLLARRLARAGRADEAKEYFDEKTRPIFDAYVKEVKTGFNQRISARRRSQAFWRAAQMAHEHGMELLGTELNPDFAIWDGSFTTYGGVDEHLAAKAGLFAPTEDERKRIENGHEPQKRFSYLYRAAELAWWAASLLPNNEDATAEILSTAGGWLKQRDPAAANSFYQALVIRCGRTEFGRAAAEKRWFP